MSIRVNCIAAALCIASFPPLSFWPCAWIALVPLLAVLAGAPGKRAFMTGWLFGVLYTIGLAYWIFHALYMYSNAGFVVSLLFLLALAAGLGLYYAVAALCIAKITQRALPTMAQVLATTISMRILTGTWCSSPRVPTRFRH